MLQIATSSIVVTVLSVHLNKENVLERHKQNISLTNALSIKYLGWHC